MENILIEALNNILLENRESKNINLARKYLTNNGYDNIQAQKILDWIRTDIPNSRLGQCKFLSGVARLYLNGELSDGNSIESLNKTLPYISSESHINEYDNNLNNLSLTDIVERFKGVSQQNAEDSRKKSYNKRYNKNNNYNIVKIPDFETANKYSEYTSWCVTHYINMYNSYTNNGTKLFYFCLENGFENVPKEEGKNCPLDDYGLSMIAVSVDEDGEPNTITSRWNHDLGGNDSVMTKDELEDLLGVNFYEVFKPYTDEELMAKGKITHSMAIRMLSQGVSPQDIFNEISEFINGLYLVKLNNKYSLMDTNNNLTNNGNIWFDWIGDNFSDKFGENFLLVQLNRKYSLVNVNKNMLVFDAEVWFDDIEIFYDNLVKVKLNDKYSLIKINGDKLFFDDKIWFDDIEKFYEGLAKVKLNDKYSYIDVKGNLICNGQLWFDKTVFLGDSFGGMGEKNGKRYLFDSNMNFYDYETKQRIPIPLDTTNESKKNIKNIIHELLQEYSSDQRLPFDDDYFKNKNYLEQYTDWLEDFGKYGRLPSSKLDFWDEIKKAIKYIISNKLRNHAGLGLPNNYEMIYNDLHDKIIGNKLIFNENGNVYVERQIQINNSITTYDNSDSNGIDQKKLYNDLVQNYNNNVGGCWSYKKDGSYSYCSNSTGDNIVMKGYIRTDDIDFVKTVLLNFRYPNEHEIRVKPNSKIEIIEVILGCKYKMPLKGSLIVNATYFGNNSSYKGEYATVDDGFGNLQFIDRSGNIKDYGDVVKDKISKGFSYDEIFDEIQNLNNGFKKVKFSKKYTLIDKNNELIGNGNLWFDEIRNFIDGFAKVKNNNKISLIDNNGNLLNNGKLWFDFIDSFENGFAEVKLNNKYSFINTNGKLIGNGKLWFDYVSNFNQNGYALVELNNLDYFIDEKGNFYDYETKQQRPSPIDNNIDESKKYIKNIVKEAINQYLYKNNYLI